jgi:hypothetical protein
MTVDLNKREAIDETVARYEKIAEKYAEDGTYTKQYFTIGRQAHVRSTQASARPR